ncbi:flagellar biosynthetic protein FliO [Rugamonas sp. CCM 8940]|uniref:flagellar biosynthetic protein FliO n=1 Tax=Rugamonas sp. CCM 8940 TaxID=2765359 RepID=UPI0018F4A80F|nr:flagellar biosynthetic protein FliO [Rugamonas sp. CCM 8940]MBJ7309175.1 flagellar biosynthetic protein FliO [Rugamonas sp. CCM 8940]
MKPAVLFTTLLLAAAALPASAQHSASGTIAPAPAAPQQSASVSAPLSNHPPAGPATATAAPSNAVATATPAAAEPAVAAADTAPAAKAGSAMVLPAPAPLVVAAPSASAPSAPSSAGGLVQTTLALAFVLALLVGLAWLLKRYGPKTLGNGGGTVRLVGSLSVGTRERILVVEVGEQWIVVGASPGRMNALATMPRQQQDEIAGNPQAGLPGANFAEWFKQTIEKRNGK